MVRHSDLVAGCVFLSLLMSTAFSGGTAWSQPTPANRLNYLQTNDPYWPGTHTARLATPQWIGEPGVDAVVVLAIDDMRQEPKYENYLRPILQRLKAIDGRAAVSIMTCRINPESPLHRQWLDEGLSLEVHTYDHPCPILCKTDFPTARGTYERCVDLLNSIPANRPVAFRTPCCDSLNTVSPRFFHGIFNQRTPDGHFLTIDSSVFVVFNDADPQLPDDLTQRDDGQPRFERYIPQDRAFVNTIENYPYPYVIGNLCWEFPCVVPSDWSAQHLQQPNNPQTVTDWKRALDATVLKQGVMNLVFHPHGWIQNEQMVELIDYAAETYGQRVKFLTFKEAQSRLDQHLLNGAALRSEHGADAGVRVLDVNGDGWQDVLIPRDGQLQTRLWDPVKSQWRDYLQPSAFDVRKAGFGVAPDGQALVISNALAEAPKQALRWDPETRQFASFSEQPLPVDPESRVRLIDVDGNGRIELLSQAAGKAAVVHELSSAGDQWQRRSYSLPDAIELGIPNHTDTGLRFVDVDQDGTQDVLFSNAERAAGYLFSSEQGGWTRSMRPGPQRLLPPFLRDGFEAGVWFHSDSVWVQNEATADLPDLVDRRSFDDLIAAADPVPFSPDQSLSQIEVPDGYVVELVASEPLIADPVAFDWGPDGRLWVVEMNDYPDIPVERPPSGRVSVLSDEDGDGRYDKSVVFVESLNAPNGVLPWRDGALISAAPDILFARDTDGDGVADEVKKLFSGFVTGNQQHRVNGFVWGLDGWLHCANGDSGGTITSASTGQRLDLAGRDFRIHPDTGAIELVAGRTQFGRRRDDWGNWFGSNNSRPMYHYVLQDAYLRRNPFLRVPTAQIEVPDVPGAAPCYPISRALPRFNDFDRLNRFTSACSAMVYRDDLVADLSQPTMFVSEPVHNLVHRELLRTEGVEFHSRRFPHEQTSEFLRSRDNWFRPTMLKTGPDGALWIADMYRLVIEHPQYIPREMQQQWDLNAGSDRGRIYKVSRRDRPLREYTPLSSDELKPLIAALDSPNGWVRDMAHRLLLDCRDKQTENQVRELTRNSPRPATRLQAFCVLAGLDDLCVADIHAGLIDSHPAVVRHAIRLAEQFTKNETIRAAVLRQADHADPFVRLQLAYSLGLFPAEMSSPVLARLIVAESTDSWQRLAALSSLRKENVIDVLRSAQRNLKDERGEQLIAQICELAVRMDMGLEAIEVVVQQFDSQPGELEDRFQFLASVLPVFRPLLDSQTESEALQQLRRVLQSAQQRAIAVVQNSTGRRWSSAVRLLGLLPINNQLATQKLLAQLSAQTPPAQQIELIDALTERGGELASRELIGHTQRLTPAVRSHLVGRLLRSETSTRVLLAALESGSLGIGDLSPVQRQQLADHRLESIRKSAQQLFQASQSGARAEIVQRYLAALDQPGDRERGRELFKKHCSTCHQIGSLGKNLGPNLMALSDPAPQSILISMFDPNRAVESKYQVYAAITNDGLQHYGLLKEESGGSLTLVSSEGREQVLVRSELEELINSGKSYMPEGLERELKVKDVADVLAFLRAAGPKPKTFPGNNPQVVRAKAGNQLSLEASLARIYGASAVFERRYENIGYWQGEDVRAVWDVEIPADLKYDIVIDYACPPDTAGNTVRVEIGSAVVKGRVQSTGSWDDYRQLVVGNVRLKKGSAVLTVRGQSPLKNYLFDLRTVRLAPSKRQ